MEVRDWYKVRLSDSGIRLEVSPPNRQAWREEIAWADIVRVCFKAEDGLLSDGWYLFTKHRPESYAIPVRADGGEALLDALLKRGLFDAQLATRAASALSELFCWPPLDGEGAGQAAAADRPRD
ncbi:MAG TPA: hypothetical protein VJ739_10055 [Gemmataceae bacterium]|nr:hypothetical protein [Gemmataceae bacterium]